MYSAWHTTVPHILEKIHSQDGVSKAVIGKKAAIKKRKHRTHLVSEDELDTSIKSAKLKVEENAQSNENTSIEPQPPKIDLELNESKFGCDGSSSITQQASSAASCHSPATHSRFEDYANLMDYQPNAPRLHKTQFIDFESEMGWRNSVLNSYNTFTGNNMRWGVNELKVGRIPDDQSHGQVGTTPTKRFETFNHYGTVFYLNTFEEEMMAACLTLVELSQPNKEKYLNISTENDRDLTLSTEEELDACFTLIGFKKQRCFFASDGIAVTYRREKKLRGFQRGFFNHTCGQHSKCSTQPKDNIVSDTR
ncbi:hypothetical protein BOTCAL_0706g00040 [Botryotinia calthae]|uniref:Uncharacterized protein n=1 Tax=Botryotinia calthae TaxID=38488 RepID=A0A4Y8CJJ6_9HELO|nr:hypothetical protein BOTCAL_0706g00040 [Botryotinia calthae]